MIRLDLPGAVTGYPLLLWRIAAVFAMGTMMLGAVSVLLAMDLAQVSLRLWEIGQTTTVLAVLAAVLGFWLSQEKNPEPLE
jgi:hypothetical protein